MTENSEPASDASFGSDATAGAGTGLAALSVPGKEGGAGRAGLLSAGSEASDACAGGSAAGSGASGRYDGTSGIAGKIKLGSVAGGSSSASAGADLVLSAGTSAAAAGAEDDSIAGISAGGVGAGIGSSTGFEITLGACLLLSYIANVVYQAVESCKHSMRLACA